MDNYQPDSIICSILVLMKNGMVQMIMWVTTHNVILCVTTTLHMLVLV